MTKAFSRELLDGFCFVDEQDLFTDAYHTALEQALETLPTTLDVDEKLHLVTLFARVCLADGDVNPRERELLHQAATYLGLTHGQVARHLGSATA